MPIIQYQTVEGVLSREQKADLSKALSDAVAGVLGEGLRPNIWVTLNELPEGNMYLGGHNISASAIKKAMAS